MAIAGAGAAALAAPIVAAAAPVVIDAVKTGAGMAVDAGMSLAQSMANSSKDNSNPVTTS